MDPQRKQARFVVDGTALDPWKLISYRTIVRYARGYAPLASDAGLARDPTTFRVRGGKEPEFRKIMGRPTAREMWVRPPRESRGTAPPP